MDIKPLLIASTLILLTLAPAGNAATFNDDRYHEYILTDHDTAHIDVIIIPSASPYALRDVSTIILSLRAWEAGIQSEADSWLANNFEMDIYTVGYDVVPSDALSDPEIIVAAGEFNPAVLFGIGYTLPTKDNCAGWNPFDPSLWHQHAGSPWAVTSSGCARGGNQCIALNTNNLHYDGPVFTLNGGRGERSMYDLVAHEVGHCLGIGHVGDALDFSANRYPATDIMSYQQDSNQVHCVSSLNIKSLQGVFADALGAPATQPRYVEGDFVHMDRSDYYNVSCSNPDTAWELPV